MIDRIGRAPICLQIAAALSIFFSPGNASANVAADSVASDARPPATASFSQARAYTYALGLFSQKQYDDEIAFLNGYLSSDSSDAYAFFLRALALFQSGEYRFVEADLSHAIDLKPQIAPAYRMRCLTRYQLGDDSEAKSDCDLALRINPTDSRAYAYRGDVLIQLGYPAQALADYERSMRLGVAPGSMHVRKCEAEAGLGDYRAADIDCELGVREDPGDWFALQARANLENRENKFERALHDATESLRLGAGPESLLERATANIQLARYREAGLDANLYLTAVPGDEYALIARAVARAVAGDRDGAEADVLSARANFSANNETAYVTWIAWFRLQLHNAPDMAKAMRVKRAPVAIACIRCGHRPASVKPHRH